MGLPKKRKSRSRSRMTRAVWLASAHMPSLVRCKHCGQMKASHRICPDCGWYAGRQVTTGKAD